jgi:hypothetical protein
MVTTRDAAPGAGSAIPSVPVTTATDPDALPPEVAAAIGGLERSIEEVARWENLLASREAGLGGPEAPLPAFVLPAPADADHVGVAPAASRPTGAFALDPAMFTPAFEPAEPVLLDPATLAVALPQQAGPAADAKDGDFLTDAEVARQRRNGRILSWAGAVILVVMAALWFLPDHTPARPKLVDDTTTTVFAPGFPNQVTVTAPVDPAATSTSLTPFTVPPTAATAPANRGTTKPAAATTTTTQAAQITSPSITSPPATTTTEAPTTTTTEPAPTTTAPPVTLTTLGCPENGTPPSECPGA